MKYRIMTNGEKFRIQYCTFLGPWTYIQTMAGPREFDSLEKVITNIKKRKEKEKRRKKPVAEWYEAKIDAI